MSEQAAEAPARQPAGKKDNIFTRKIGPMPMWAWLAILSVIILAWAWYQNKKNPAAQSGTANASQVPQFVNQTYTTVIPPTAPVPGKPPPVPDKDKDKDKDKVPDKDKPPVQGGGSEDEDEHRHRKRHRRRRHPTHHDRDASAVPVGASAPQPAAAVHPGMM